MAEQREQYDVTFYCNKCALRRGKMVTVGVAAHDLGGEWRFWVTRRADRAAFATVAGPAVGDPPRKLLAFGNYLETPGRRVVHVPFTSGSAAQFICRGCPARPREARAVMVELAERTVAAGRRDAYV